MNEQDAQQGSASKPQLSDRPDLDAAVAIGNSGLLLLAAGRPAEAAEAFKKQVRLVPYFSDAWYHLALALTKLTDTQGTEVALRQTLALDPAHLDANLRLATLLHFSHRSKEAKQYAVAGARYEGTVVKPCVGPNIEARVLLVQSAIMGNLPSRALFDHNRFETISTTILPPDAGGLDLLQNLPPYDIVLNCVADADNGAEPLRQAEDFCRDLTCPLLNPPARIAPTRRDLIPALLGDIPNLIVPHTRRATRAEVAALAVPTHVFDPPLLIRPFGSHGGNDLERLDNTTRLAAYLSLVPYDEFYLTDYSESRRPDGYWCKYRLIFVDREVYPYHLAIAKKWMVHYWRADMEAAPWMKQEEEAFLADYRSVFDGPRGEAVREVARRLDLDYAGLDCAIAPDGRVLLFEANATMLVHLDDSRDEFPYKHVYVPRIFDAISAMINRRLGK